MFPLYGWYNLKGQLIRKKILCAKKKPNIPGAEGIESLILRITKTVRSDYFRGGCTILIVC